MKSALKITFTYSIVSICWIIISDKINTILFSNINEIVIISILKGILFIIVTSILLYLLINAEIRKKNVMISDLDKESRVKEELIRELHHRIKNNIQVMIGIMNIETIGIDGSGQFKNRITNKLISMMSVFNIVYDMKNMNDISFTSVLKEYKTISTRNIIIKNVDINTNYSLEVITSCLLLIDSFIEVFIGNNNSIRTIIEAPEKGLIKLSLYSSCQNVGKINENDSEFLRLMAQSIDGKIDINEVSKDTIVKFTRFV